MLPILAFIALAPQSGTITPLVLEGDSVPGVGNVTRIDNLAVNDAGDWIVEADTDHSNTDADVVLIKNGALHLREDDPLSAPAGSSINSFDSVNLTAQGHSVWNFFLSPPAGSSDDSGVYFDTTLVILENSVSGAPQFSAGTPYIGFFEVLPNSSGQALIVASVDDPAIASSVDRALVVIALDGSGNLLSEDARYKEGDVLSGQTEAVADFGTGPHSSAMNDNGDLLFVVDLTGSTSTDGAVYLNDTLLAQEGSPSPVAGRNWLSLPTSTKVALNSSGDWVLTGRLDGDTATDNVIVRNGAILVQEGDSLPDIGGFQITSFGSAPVAIDDSGSVVWYGVWNDPDTTRNTGLFVDHQLVVQAGVSDVGGTVLEFVAGVQDAFALSPGGLNLVFEGRLAGGVDGAFLAPLASRPTVYCTAQTNSQGCTPQIGFSGLPSASDPNPFLVTAAQVLNNKNGLLFYGYDSAAVPFGGGILCVRAPLRRTPVQNSGGNPPPNDCSGFFSFDFNARIQSGIDPNLVAGSEVFCQYWSRDPQDPSGTNLTDALSFEILP